MESLLRRPNRASPTGGDNVSKEGLDITVAAKVSLADRLGKSLLFVDPERVSKSKGCLLLLSHF